MIHFVSFVAGTALWHAWPLMPRLCILALLLSAPLLSYNKKHAAAFVLIVGFSLALVRAPSPPPDRWDNPYMATGYFSEPARHYERFNSQPFVPDTAPDGAPASFNVLSGMKFYAGRTYTLNLRMITSRQRGNPGAWGSGVYARVAGDAQASRPKSVDAEKDSSALRYMAHLREDLGREIDSLLPLDEASLVKAVTVGLRDGMPLSVKRDFRRSGIAHLLSISGTHFGFFAVALFFLIRAAIERMPHRTLLAMSMHISPAQAAALLTLPLMLFYLGLSGGSAPSVRAFIMIGFFLFGLIISAKGRWQSFLAAAAFALALIDPLVLATPSFLMSFSAVLFIGLALKRPQHFIREESDPDGAAMRTAKLLVVRPLMLTMAATLGVMPLVIHWFHELSIISPLANILVTGIAGLLLIPLSIAGAVTYTAFGSFITAPLVEPLASAALGLAHALSSPWWASIAVPPMPVALILIYYACTLPWLITRNRRLMPLLLVPLVAYFAIAIYSASSKEVTLTFLDTGRSDSMVMELPGRRAVVIDTSRSGTEVSAYLRTRGIRSIDALVLTHSHHDHTGGGNKLATYFDIKEVFDNGKLRKKHLKGLEAIPMRHLQSGDFITLPGVTLTALHPYKGYESASGGSQRTNNHSLVLRAKAQGGSSALLTGDLQADGIAALGRLSAEELESNVLKIPHHGKQPPEARALFKMASPSVSVLTGYGAHGLGNMPVLSTGEHGAIKVDLSSSPPVVKTFAGFSPKKHPQTFAEEFRNLASLFTVW